MVNRENDLVEYARGCLKPNERWSGIATECEGQMRRGDAVVEMEDIRRARIRWRGDRIT